MKTTGIVRKVDELGRVVLPKELRDVLHIETKDPLEIFVDPDTTRIILKKYQGSSCLFCGDCSLDLMYFKKHLVCRNCAAEASASLKPGGQRIEASASNPEVAAALSTEETPARQRRESHKPERSGADEALQRLYEARRMDPEASQARLAQQLGISQGYVSILMKKLRATGKI